MTNQPPLYRQLARQLREQISSGQFDEGQAFPPEMEICERHGVSRHTAREALRILTDDGLIERRRGIGTVVRVKHAPAFSQTIGDFDDLLQYAGDTVFEVFNKAEAQPQTLDRFGLSGSYERLDGIRRVLGQPPQAAVTILIRSDLARVVATSGAIPGSITERLEAAGKLTVDRVGQRMDAVALSPSRAKAIAAEAGVPALRTVRRYRDPAGSVAVLSESFHPQGRFAYEMSVGRRSR